MKAKEILPLSLEEIQSKIKNSNSTSSSKEFKLILSEKLFQAEFPSSNLEQWRKLPLSNFKLKDFISNSSFTFDSNYEISNFYKEEILKYYSKDFFVLLNLLLVKEIEILNFKGIQEYKILNQFSNFQNNFTRALFIEVEKNSEISIFESTKSQESEEFQLYLPFTYILLGENSTLNYSFIDKNGSSDFQFKYIHTNQKKDSNLNLFHFHLNGYKGKTLIQSYMNGSNSNLNIKGAAALSGREIQDIEAAIVHNASYTHSEILYRTAVNGKSHHIFTGNLHIPQSTKKVNATQVNHNLSLSKTARAESIPKLEVFSDDVQCSHGATVSEVNPEQLFYLMSRGLTESESRYIIIEGFLREIVDSLKEETIKEEIIQNLTQKLVDSI